MLFLLIFWFSFIFFFKSFTFKPPPSSPPMMSEIKLFFSPFFWEEISSFLVSWFHKHKIAIGFYQVPYKMPLKNIHLRFKETENLKQENTSLLDLPELALDSILEKLSPSGLCSMTGVCSFLRDKCTSDHLWEKHLKQKWSSVICDAAFKEWQFHSASRKRLAFANHSNQKSLLGSLGIVCSLSRIKPKFESRNNLRTTSLPVDSIMAMYLSLEKGKFWFPAQVYNRENGHVGFLLSCYDAKVCYDSGTDTFQARYSPYGRRMIEDGIVWDRLRAPPIETPAHDLHISDCLNDLKPGDHIEIQWRRSKEFPYGWWYAIVGHIDTCDGNENHCHCQYNDKVVLEFNQYSPGSRWRQTIINRKDHKEEGNEADGFYGGIRKLYSTEEISTWKKLGPSQVFE